MITFQIEEFVVFLDDEFEYLKKYNWKIKVIPNSDRIYVYTYIDSILHFMHHLVIGNKEHYDVDHKDRNGLNNQKENLRFCTRSQNNANAKKRSNCISSFKGVNWCNTTNKWRARVANSTIGRFETEEEAARAYDKAATIVFGEFARLNFPEV